MRLARGEQFDLDLLDSGRSYGVTLRPDAGEELIEACDKKLRSAGYKSARDQALTDALVAGDIVESEWDAYKDLIDRHFGRKMHAANKVKHRPFAPLEAYEDDP